METGPDGRSRATAWLVAAVIAAACLPYLTTIPDYFVQDDFGVIKVLTARPWTMFPRWFVMPWTENTWGYTPDEIRPFVAFTYQLTGKWNPARPELHHLFNIAMHAGNGLLVTALARSAIRVSMPAAALAGVVFAVLPGQAPSVAWVTGRVDSMPAFFYLASFLAYVRWRESHRWSVYAWALALFFVALFSKQNTITMVATLASYDLVLLARSERRSRVSAVLAWVPFVLLTVGFLALRRLLFGQSLRTGPQHAYELAAIAAMLAHHVQRTLFGHVGPLSRADLIAVAVFAAGLLLMLVRSARDARARFTRALAFSVIWIAIGLAPVALAGYESPRHAYLASAGWAFVLALVADRLSVAFEKSLMRRVVAGAACAAVVMYAARLVPVVRSWNAAGRISEAAVSRVQQEAHAATPGTLVIAGVPLSSWEWSSPFVLQPPFAPSALDERVHLITRWRQHCCGRDLWDAYTREHLRAWSRTSPRPPIVALRFAPESGALSRMTDAEFPELRQIVPELLKTPTSDELDNVIADILERMVSGHPVTAASR